jgi:serine protease Do
LAASLLSAGFARGVLAAEGAPPEPKFDEPPAVAEKPAADDKASPPEPTAEDKALAAALAKRYPTTVEDLRAIEKGVTKVIDKISAATVGVQIGGSQGSGVIISEDGYVLTAGHVSGKPKLDVRFILPDGSTVKGKTLGLNRGIDSGLMKIADRRKWDYVPMADAGTVKPGDWCIAIGHPGGYERGRRPVVRLGRVLFRNDKVICTDCTLVGGDSGGPLFDLEGNVIGIHSRIGWQITTNFHVPVGTYHDTWDRLVAGEMWGGRLPGSNEAGARPLIGVAGDPSEAPCTVRQVFPGSPAQQAGLKIGDVIRKFDGSDVDNFSALSELVAKKKPGDKIPVLVERAEKTITLELVLGVIRGRLPGGAPEPKKEDEDE